MSDAWVVIDQACWEIQRPNPFDEELFAKGTSYFGAGDYNRQVAQQGLDDRYRQFLEQRDWGLRNFDVLKSGLTGLPYGQTQQTSTPRDPWSQLLGAGMTIGGFFI